MASAEVSSIRQRSTESTREREVFKYLHPWQAAHFHGALTQPISLLQRAQHVADNPPIGCDDTALAAFAQLGALRLKVQRCTISLLSSENEYILAESTRTLSLQSDDVHNLRDALWIGTASFPREDGLTTDGMDLWRKAKYDRPAVTEKDHYHTDGLTPHWYIVSDLRQHPELQERPFVTLSKALRFICAIPIRAQCGRVIGSYTLLDDKPHFGISEDEMKFLEDMSNTVMNHLEAKRATAQRQRGDRLIKGLGLFNDGKSSLRQWWMVNNSKKTTRGRHKKRRGSDSNQAKDRTAEAQENAERADEEFGQTYLAEGNERDNTRNGQNIEHPDAENNPHKPSTEHISTVDFAQGTTNGGSLVEENNASIAGSAQPPAAGEHGADCKNQNKFDLAREVNNVFSRASNLIREAVDGEGIIFLDTDFPSSRRVGRYQRGDKADESTTTSDSGSSTGGSDGDRTSPQSRHKGRHNRRSSSVHSRQDTADLAGQTCSLLGFSTRTKSTLRGFAPSGNHNSLPRELIAKFLRRYPNGKIFNYYNSGSAYSSSGEENTSGTGDLEPNSKVVQKAKQQRSKSAREAAALSAVLPEARSIAFLPLWDTHRERWRSGVLLWSNAPHRFFSPAEDLTYLATFGNNILAELARLDAIAADQAKATFISSVSHELRSPLHGVLAGVEYLQESKLSPFQKEMATTITMAGTTLLDTINNLLDFTKINNFTDAQRATRNARDRTRQKGDTLVDEVGVSTVLDVATLTETVVETVVAAKQLKNIPSQRSKRKAHGDADGTTTPPVTVRFAEDQESDGAENVYVLLDITKSPSWSFRLSPGSWTRVITNLLSNALKYTEKGHITVKLSCDDPNDEENPEMRGICLSITDTGRGMSEEYRKHHLYTPFMQEDSHSTGTGLGLSIVKQIVGDLGGTINVDSKLGVGTAIHIRVPAEHSSGSEDNPQVADLPDDLSIAMFTSKSKDERSVSPSVAPDAIEKREKLLRASLRRTCSTWLGRTCDTISPRESAPPDVLILGEDDYEEITKGRWRGRECPSWLNSGTSFVICGFDLNSAVEQDQSGDATDNVVFIHQPFGPRKLARAITTAAQMAQRRREEHPRTASPRQLEYKPTSPGSSSPTTSRRTSPTQDLRRRSLLRQASHSEQSESPTHSESRSGSSPPPASRPSSRASVTSNRTSPVPSPGTVLLVEDNPINLKLLIASMRKLRQSYATAVNGLEAVEKYTASPSTYSLVFMDMSMPVMDGFTATERIREFERRHGLRRCRILALTGVASAEAREGAFRNGVDDFVVKPVSMSRLREIVLDVARDREGEDSRDMMNGKAG